MGRKIEMVGRRFGRLVVLDKPPIKENNEYHWFCLCDCGVETEPISGHSLRRGVSNSCGCLARERRLAGTKTHGKGKTRLYRIYHNMKSRCYNKNRERYKNYGGRGISVCDEWLADFKAFYDWSMANGYSDELQIDRIDVNGNYEPSNCRWVTVTDQANNKRNNKK